MVDTKTKCARMAVDHQAEILTGIFQSEIDALDGGICRGIVQFWLATHFDAIDTGSTEVLPTARKNQADVGTKKTSMFVSVHEDLKFSKPTNDLKFVSLGRRSGIKIDHDEISLGQITFCFDALFPHNGFYYVNLPKHCFGLRREDAYILFIDANTCEWRIPTKNFLHKAFLLDHMATFYAEGIFDTISTIYFP